MINFILDYFEANIYIALAIFTLASQMGIPLGAMFLIMFAGSITFTIFNLFFLILIISIFTITGDLIAYKIGEKYGVRLLKKFENKKFIKKNLNKSKKLMNKYGSFSIFFTRFLITGLGPTMNYFAGFSKFSFKKFIPLVIFGEILYAIIFSSLGYFFKDTWEDLLIIIKDFSYIILMIIIFFILLKKTYKHYKN